MFPLASELPFPGIVRMAHEYLDIVVRLKTPTQSSAIKAHLFRLCRPALEVHKTLRESLGKSRFDDKASGEAMISMYREFVHALETRLDADMKDDKYKRPSDPPLPGSVSHLTPPDPENPDVHRPAYVPHWLAQPYFRPPLIEGGKEAEKKIAAANNNPKPVDAKDARPRSDSVDTDNSLHRHDDKRARIHVEA